jgi:putative iron-dependent peroxidase
MFVGLPPDNYDRLLDVSRAVTGSLFFVPSVPLLESLADAPADGDDDPADGEDPGPDQAGTAQDGTAQDGTDDDHAAGPAAPPGSAGSLGIGSLRGVTQHG